MKHFRSEKAFAKYKPEESWKKKLSRVFKRKQKVIPISDLPSHYTTNPYKAKNQTRPNRTGLKLILLLLIIVGWIFSLAYTPYFKIEKILYFNLGNTSRTELDSFVHNNYLNRKSWLPVDNYFFITETRLASDIKDHFSLENVEVTKVFPNTLNIEVQEKEAAIVYDNGEKYFLLDKEGGVIKEIADVGSNELIKLQTPISNSVMLASSTTASSTVTTTISITTPSTSTPAETLPLYKHTPNNERIKRFFADYPIIYDKRALDINHKQKNILTANLVESLIAWQKELSQRGRLKPKFFTLENLNSGIIINTGEPWYIMFQPQSSTETQIKILDELLPTIKPKEYVDLRFQERVYWK